MDERSVVAPCVCCAVARIYDAFLFEKGCEKL